MRAYPLRRRVLIRLCASLLGLGSISGLAGGAHALVITPVFDKTITSLSNAAAVEGAVNQAIGVFDRDFTSKANIQIGFSWGSIDGQKLASGNVSESLSFMYTGFSYANVVSDLQMAASSNPTDKVLVSAVAHLPTKDPTGLNKFSITEADAQALGVTPPSGMGVIGYVGFSSLQSYDLNPADGTGTGTYDLVALAEHEISEVMGRISGVNSSAPTYATPFDVFRYSAVGKNSFSYSSGAYFSVDGGLTRLASFNYSGTGDRGDWLTTSTTTDEFDATASKSVDMGLSAADLAVLDALGWDTPVNPQGWAAPAVAAASGASGGAVPEPELWSLMILGAALSGANLRRRRSSGAQVA